MVCFEGSFDYCVGLFEVWKEECIEIYGDKFLNEFVMMGLGEDWWYVKVNKVLYKEVIERNCF